MPVASRLSPNDPEVLILYSEIEREVRERPEEAIKYAEQGIERDPNNSTQYRRLAWALQLDGRYAEAVEALQEAALLAPASAGVQRELALAQFNLGQNEEALDTLRFMEQVNNNDSPNGPPWYGYGYGLLG